MKKNYKILLLVIISFLLTAMCTNKITTENSEEVNKQDAIKDSTSVKQKVYKLDKSGDTILYKINITNNAGSPTYLKDLILSRTGKADVNFKVRGDKTVFAISPVSDSIINGESILISMHTKRLALDDWNYRSETFNTDEPIFDITIFKVPGVNRYTSNCNMVPPTE